MSAIEALLDNLSPKQQSTLANFRRKVADILRPDHDDFFLLRWLRARNFDIDKAEVMLRKSLSWRKNYGTDDLLKWDPPEVLKRYWPGGIFGYDRFGHPMLWQLSSNFDVTGMLKSVKRSDIIKYHIWRLEKLRYLCQEQSKKLGKRVSCTVHISDLNGFSLKTVFAPGITDITKEVFALTEANYPETLHSSYVINAPGVFAVFFNILKPFLSEDTRRKVHICGSNWRERLAEVAEDDQIPAFWGGTALQPDPECSDYIIHCEPIPLDYYIHDKILLNKETMKQINVPAKDSRQLKYAVTAPGTVIRWVFETEHYDIAYGVFFTPRERTSTADRKNSNTKDDASPEEIRQVSRVNCQLVPEDGNLTCHAGGTYTFKLDNTYSWVHSKHVYYDIEVIPPMRDSIVFQGVSVDDDDILEITHL